MKERTFKLDIFQLLGNIDRQNYSTWSKLTEDERKGFAPLVVMRWMSGTSDERQILALNSFTNQMIFPLAKHPELLMKLLCGCASGKPKRYQWIPVKPANKKKAESLRVIQEFFGVSSREAKMYNVPSDELLEMANHIGWQKEEIAKLKKELT